MKTSDINIRDPFVLVYDNSYYLYGTRGETSWGIADGFDVYVSKDLENWEGPIAVFSRPDDFWADRHFWAPEVHFYNDKFYMFASFKSENECRGTQILIADSPVGPFRIHSDGPVTPRDWECLDGTLYIDKNGEPHMIFCHEWLQIHDGTMCEIKLSKDLKKAISKPRVLFSASEAKPWVCLNRDDGTGGYVTDGPFMYVSLAGKLYMMWSSFGKQGYTQALSVSDNGDISGNFSHVPELLFEKDGGHGMIFKSIDGELLLTLHAPNDSPNERPVFYKLNDIDGRLSLDK